MMCTPIAGERFGDLQFLRRACSRRRASARRRAASRRRCESRAGRGSRRSRVNSLGSRIRRSIGSRSIHAGVLRAAVPSLRAVSTRSSLAEAQLGDIARKEQFERPVEGDAQFPVEPRQAQQVVRSPKKPRDEAGDDVIAGKLRDRLAVRRVPPSCRATGSENGFGGSPRSTRRCYRPVRALRGSRAAPSSDRRRPRRRESRRSRRAPRRARRRRRACPGRFRPRRVSSSAATVSRDRRRRFDAGAPNDRLALDAPPALQRQAVLVGAGDAVAGEHFDAAPLAECAANIRPSSAASPASSVGPASTRIILQLVEAQPL